MLSIFAEWFQPVGRQIVGTTVGAQRSVTTLTDETGATPSAGAAGSAYPASRRAWFDTLAHGEIYIRKAQSVGLTTSRTQE
jgi:hypothetical protein